MTGRGFMPVDGPGVPLAQGPEALRDLGLRRELAGYQVAPAQLAGLVELAGLRRSGVGGALVELPTLGRAPPPGAGARHLPQILVRRGSPTPPAGGRALFQDRGGCGP